MFGINSRKEKDMYMRKNKKSIGSRAVGNRTIIGIICIVAALAICFGIAPMVNKLRDGKAMVVRVSTAIEKGAIITDANIEVVEVGSFNLPGNVVKSKDAVIGKFPNPYLRIRYTCQPNTSKGRKNAR